MSLTRSVAGYSGHQFALFRMLLGGYLALFFLRQLPWATELLSDDGVLPLAMVPGSWTWFPGIFRLVTGPVAVQIVVATLAVLAAMLAVGLFRRVVSVVLWYGMASMVSRNRLLDGLMWDYVGLMLLATAVLPKGEPWRIGASPQADAPNWWMPLGIFVVLWTLLAGGYLWAGLAKLPNPLWRDGRALQFILASPQAADHFVRDATRRCACRLSFSRSPRGRSSPASWRFPLWCSGSGRDWSPTC